MKIFKDYEPQWQLCSYGTYKEGGDYTEYRVYLQGADFEEDIPVVYDVHSPVEGATRKQDSIAALKISFLPDLIDNILELKHYIALHPDEPLNSLFKEDFFYNLDVLSGDWGNTLRMEGVDCLNGFEMGCRR
jgi:hypothetical protein